MAPIFEHGKGRSAVGCEVINPPVFLSEQDAMQVILEELKKVGITQSDAAGALSDVSVPDSIQAEGSEPMILEASDSKKKIGFSVVVMQTYFDLGGEISPSSVQPYRYLDLAKRNRDSAEASARNLYFGTFYDPAAPETRVTFKDPRTKYDKKMADLHKKLKKTVAPALKKRMEEEYELLRKEMEGESKAFWEKRLDVSKNESRRLLRLQVKDFVDWLKGQGVI